MSHLRHYRHCEIYWYTSSGMCRMVGWGCQFWRGLFLHLTHDGDSHDRYFHGNDHGDGWSQEDVDAWLDNVTNGGDVRLEWKNTDGEVDAAKERFDELIKEKFIEAVGGATNMLVSPYKVSSEDLHPAVVHLLKEFDPVDEESLCHPMDLHYHNHAHRIAAECTGQEATVALRKLLESRDAAFRALR